MQRPFTSFQALMAAQKSSPRGVIMWRFHSVTLYGSELLRNGWISKPILSCEKTVRREWPYPETKRMSVATLIAKQNPFLLEKQNCIVLPRTSSLVSSPAKRINVRRNRKALSTLSLSGFLVRQYQSKQL